ncbi:hypothetical protein C0992_003663 [Termitomyces sp. T32_za158]|nr:hypothetical protein C0992_003663 [Termitomyces sp. T32_za158]
MDATSPILAVQPTNEPPASPPLEEAPTTLGVPMITQAGNESTASLTDNLKGGLAPVGQEPGGPRYEVAFPPLPQPQPEIQKKLAITINRRKKQTVENQTEAQTAGPPSTQSNFRFTYECRSAREPDSSKRPPPFSPIKDRTPKRHTSASVPPYATPNSLTQIQPERIDWSPSPQPKSTPAQIPQPAVTPFIGSGSTTPSMSSPAPLALGITAQITGPLEQGEAPPGRSPSSCPHLVGRQGPQVEAEMIVDVDDDIFTPRTAALKTWDNILVDSPPSSPSHLHPPPPSQNRPGRERSPMSRRGEREGHPGPSGIFFDRALTEGHITTNCRGLRRTAEPNGGWPKIHLFSSPWENVSDSQLEAWGGVSGARLWARTFRARYELNSLATTDLMRELIKGLVFVEKDVALGVSFPIQKRHIESDRFPLPYHMLISGLSETQVEYLESLEVVSTPEITVFFKAFHDARPSFVATIYGLAFQNSEDAPPIVTELIQKRIGDSKEITSFIMEASPLAEGAAIQEILENLVVKFIEVKRSPANGGNFRGWNLYLQHSSLSNDDHFRLMKLLRKCDFPTATAGFGTPLRGKDLLLCVGCKSVDHDTPNCPFPYLPGWLGPKPHLQTAPSTASVYDDDKQYYGGIPANRGRGRGRGGSFRGGRLQPKRGGRGY